jgi:hypothetical protein
MRRAPGRVDTDSCCNLCERISLIPALWRGTYPNSNCTNSGFDVRRKSCNEVQVADRSTGGVEKVRILRLAKLGDALIAGAISCRQYALGISRSQDTESVHKFLKSWRRANIDVCLTREGLKSVWMLTTKVLSNGRDESAPAVRMTWSGGSKPI